MQGRLVCMGVVSKIVGRLEGNESVMVFSFPVFYADSASAEKGLEPARGCSLLLFHFGLLSQERTWNKNVICFSLKSS